MEKTINHKRKTPILAELRQLFAIDLRSLALFRILIALAVIANVITLLPNLGAFLVEDGLFTRSHAVGNRSAHFFSLYYLSGATWYTGLLLLSTLGAGLALLFGFRTRIATVVTWILVVSLTNRISIIGYGGDMQLCVLLFWAMFLPLGARFSVDAALAEEPSDNRYFSVASLAILLQVLYLYFIGALLKNGSFWVESFDAVYYALTSVQVSSPLAAGLATFPSLMIGLSTYVYFLELLAIVFLFFPVIFQYTRAFVLPQLVAMHLGFAALLTVGLFPLISIAGLMLFVPALFWDRLLPWWNGRRARTGIKIYYDQDCGFCYKTCLIFRALALPATTPILKAQEHEASNRILEEEGSWSVLAHNGRYLSRWAAVAYLWRRSPLLWPLGVLFALPPMTHCGNGLYQLIARNRPAMGRFTSCVIPFRKTAIFYPRRLTTVALTILVILVYGWNIETVRQESLVPDKVKALLSTLRLTQHWNMFAPQPVHVSRWVVVEGVVASGRTIDLLRGEDGAPSHDKPRHGYQAFPSQRWRKYYDRVDLTAQRDTLGSYYCRRAIAAGYDDIQAVAIYKYRLPTPKPGDPTLDAPRLTEHMAYDCQ